MIRNSRTDRFVLIGTVFGQGFNCKTDFVGTFEGQKDGIWNKVSAHMEWIEDNMKQMGQKICKH